MTAPGFASLSVIPVTDGRSLDEFIAVPRSVFADDPNWVPPLTMERRDALKAGHPVFKHLEWQGFVAYRDGHAVGRISAQVDRLHLECHRDQTGFFGFLDAIDDPTVFAALFEQAEAWLRARGMRQARGPFSLNINQEVGLLVDGFDSRPYFMMGHARPWYGPRVEACGYTKAMDMFAYLISAHFQPPPVMNSLFERLQRKVTIRALDKRRKDADLDLVCDIFNDAWADNWGFVPFTQEEFRAIGHEMLMIIPPDFIQIAEMDGEGVAFIVLLPNVNDAIADLDGRLLPFGWAKLVSRLFIGYPRTARIPLMGVRRRLHHTRLGPGLALSVVQALREPGIRKGVEEVEMSWILETNEAMKGIIEILGGRQSKHYRVYEKALA
ncbi:MAG: N-acetyltransferase [Gammaproteobacteria bacterium]|nr:N-acetyltransferase [Gammaproteobacteria bacterium]